MAFFGLFPSEKHLRPFIIWLSKNKLGSPPHEFQAILQFACNIFLKTEAQHCREEIQDRTMNLLTEENNWLQRNSRLTHSQTWWAITLQQVGLRVRVGELQRLQGDAVETSQ